MSTVHAVHHLSFSKFPKSTHSIRTLVFAISCVNGQLLCFQWFQTSSYIMTRSWVYFIRRRCQPYMLCTICLFRNFLSRPIPLGHLYSLYHASMYTYHAPNGSKRHPTS